jgi:hypothetical protein
MRGLTGEKLRRLPVRLRGILLGRPADLILHPSAPRLVGIDVLCGDGTHRFLPSSASEVREEEIDVGSPFVLLDLPSDSLYRSHARLLSKLIGTTVGDDGAVLRDVVLGPGWTIEELVLEHGRGRRRVPSAGNLLAGRPTLSAQPRPD